MSLNSIKHIESAGWPHHGRHLSLSSWWLALISCMVRALSGPMAGPLLELGQAIGHLLLSSSPACKSIYYTGNKANSECLVFEGFFHLVQHSADADALLIMA